VGDVGDEPTLQLRDPPKLLDLVLQTVGMVAVGAIGGLAIALSAHWIVHLLYGAAFGRAVELLQLTALASTLVFADVALTLLPIHMRVPRLVAIKWALALVATLAVDAFAIPRIGAYGAILGYAVANLLSVLFGIAVWMRYRTIAQRPLGVSA
jgi:PST family polysaccharide transporter